MNPRSYVLGLSLALVGCHQPPGPALAVAPPVARSPAEARPAVGWKDISLPGDPEIDSLVAAQEFAAALEAAPARTDVRVAFAQALARGGRTAEAWGHLRRALTEDLPQVRSVALQHPDFEVLRAEHPELLSVIEDLGRAYVLALERGVPAFVYRPRPEWPERFGRDPQAPYTELRAGVYDPQTDRFVPMLPAVEGVWTVAFDLEGRRALVVSGELMTSMWLVTLGRLDARVYALDASGVLLLQAEDMVTPEMSESVSVQLDPDAPVLWLERSEMSSITYYERYDEEGSEEAGLQTWNGTTEEVSVSDDFYRGLPSVDFSLRNGPDGTNTVNALHRRPKSPVVPDSVRERLGDAWVEPTASPSTYLSIRREGSKRVVELFDAETSTTAWRDELVEVLDTERTSDGTVVVETPESLRLYRPPDYQPEPAMPGVYFSLPDLPVGEGGT